jgi:N-acetylglucosamine-6-phosphate deacetylase
LSAHAGIQTFEDVYGASNLVDAEDWNMTSRNQASGIRIITAAPEIGGVMEAIPELSKRGIFFAIGHR